MPDKDISSSYTVEVVATIPTPNIGEETPKGQFRLYLSRRGVAYKEAQEANYVYWSPVDFDIPLPFGELKSSLSINLPNNFCMYRKSLRNGFVYIYSPEDNIWIIFHQCGEGKIPFYQRVHQSKKDLNKKYKWDLLDKKSNTILLPKGEKNTQYYVAFSDSCWSDDVINHIVNDEKEREKYFKLINIEEGLKDECTGNYSPLDKMYELRDKPNLESYGNIDPKKSKTIKDYLLSKTSTKKRRPKNKVLFYTIDDIMGVADDIVNEQARFMEYKRAYVDSVNRAQKIDDESQQSQQLIDLLKSANVLYPMLYGEGGALNLEKDKGTIETKYQDLVQKYKLTKLLAVDERLKLQEKYKVLRNLLFSIIQSKEFATALNPYIKYGKETENNKLAGQLCITKYLEALSIKAESFDSNISERRESVDEYSELLLQISNSFMKLPQKLFCENSNSTSSVKKIPQNSPIIKLLSHQVILNKLLGEEKDKSVVEVIAFDYKDLVCKTLYVFDTCFKVIPSKFKINPIDIKAGLDGLYQQLTDRLDLNDKIVKTRKTQMGTILKKYTKIKDVDLNSTVDILYDKNIDPKKKFSTYLKSGSPKDGLDRTKYMLKANKEIRDAKVFNKKKYMNVERLEAFFMDLVGEEAALIEIKKTNIDSVKKSQGWSQTSQRISQTAGIVSLAFLGLQLAVTISDKDKEISVSEVICFLSNVTYAAGGLYSATENFAKMSRLVSIRGVSTTVGFSFKNALLKQFFTKFNYILIVIDLIPQMIDIYKQLKARNSEAAAWMGVTAALSLLAGVFGAVAVAAGGWLIIVTLAIAAAICIVGAYFTGKRAIEMIHDQWQSFLVNSIFSNYEENIIDSVFNREVHTKITEKSSDTYYGVANKLFDTKEEIAVNDYYYKHRNYDLQNFSEMWLLINEYSTMLQVEIDDRKCSFSSTEQGTHEFVKTLWIDVTYAALDYEELDTKLTMYVIYSGKDELGNDITSIPYYFDLDEADARTEAIGGGTFKTSLKYNIHAAMSSVMGGLPEEHIQKLKSIGAIYLDNNNIRTTVFSTSSCLAFGCRLKKAEAQASEDANNTSQANERLVYPWVEQKVDVYRGFKLRSSVPVPAHRGGYAERYYLYLNSTIEIIDGNMPAIASLKLKEVSYKTKSELINK